MKTKIQLMALCVTLLITGITSCKKEGVIVPQLQNTEGAQNLAVEANSLRPAPVWLLAKQGNNTLEYSADKKLKKVTYADGSVITYSYGFSAIIGDCVKDGVSIYKVTYFLNASGKAYQMRYKSDLIDLVYNLTYQNGHLVKQKRDYGAEAYKFSYDGANRLSRIDFFGTDGLQKEAFLYEYSNQTLTDNNAINPEEAFLDRYLAVFGTFSKELPYKIKPLKKPNFTASDIDYVFAYQMNASGLVGERNKFKVDRTTYPATVTLAEKAKYEYMQK